MKGELGNGLIRNFVILGRHGIDCFTGPNRIRSLLSKGHLLKI